MKQNDVASHSVFETQITNASQYLGEPQDILASQEADETHLIIASQ